MNAILLGITEEQSALFSCATQKPTTGKRFRHYLLKVIDKNFRYTIKKKETTRRPTIVSGVSEHSASQFSYYNESKAHLQALYLLSAQNERLDQAIDYLFSLTEENFIANRYEEVDYLLANVDYQKLNCVLIEGLLRSSYRFQKSLPSWKNSVTKAKEVFKSKFPETSYMLDGLE